MGYDGHLSEADVRDNISREGAGVLGQLPGWGKCATLLQESPRNSMKNAGPVIL